MTDESQTHRELRLPTGYLRVSITDACNMRCVYCHNEGQSGDAGLFMEVNALRSILGDAVGFGLTKLRLTGGEPLLHPRCLEMLRLAKEEIRIPFVGLNTNGVLRERLRRIVCARVVDSIVVGLDYLDGRVSKRSAVGQPPSGVLEEVLFAKEVGQDLAIACVFDGDVVRVEALAGWCLRHGIELKILEVSERGVATGSGEAFVRMTEAVMARYALKREWRADVGDYCGVGPEGTRVCFYHSHCRRRECARCGAIHMRVTASGYLKTCIQEELEFPLLGGAFADSLGRALRNVGRAPETRSAIPARAWRE